jgi:hypothetical protein
MLLGTAKGGIGTDLHCMLMLYGKEEDTEGIGWLKGLILQVTHAGLRGLGFSRWLTQRACRYLSGRLKMWTSLNTSNPMAKAAIRSRYAEICEHAGCAGYSMLELAVPCIGK